MKIVDLIEDERDEKESRKIIWKHQNEEFSTLSQLIVHESQEALLFLNGQALDLFGPGRHTLQTNNIPLLNKIINIPKGGKSAFHCEVYFIDKTEQMALKWGMGNVNFLDSTHNDYAFKIGASGEMNLRISDSRKAIMKLVGAKTELTQENIKQYLKAPIITHIKTMLPNILREKGVSIFEVESFLTELSEILKEKISVEMDDYGITVEKFWIQTILKPEDDPCYIAFNKQRGESVVLENQGEMDIKHAKYQREVEVINHTGEVQKRRMDIDVKRYEQEQLGYTYQQERGYNVMDKIAENQGSGSDLRNAAMNVGVGLGVGGTIETVFNDISRETMKSDFTEDKDDKISIFKEKLEKLRIAKETGFLSEEEFAEKKKCILDEI